MSFGTEEVMSNLLRDKFSPRYAIDVKVDDLIVVLSDSVGAQPYYVQRVESSEDEDGNGTMHFIAEDARGFPTFLSYSYYEPCMVKPLDER